METNNLKIIGQIKKLFFVVLATVAFTMLMSVSSVRAEVSATLDVNGKLTVSYTGSGDSVLTEAIVKAAVNNDKSKIKTVSIGSGVTEIGEYAFYNCENLKEVSIPESVQSISGRGFYSCKSLESIIIPSSVESIGDWAFVSCESLTDITIPSSVKSIGSSVFYGCVGLTYIIIPSSVESIDNAVFQFCENLTILIPDKFSNLIIGKSITMLQYLTDAQGNITMVWVPTGYEIPVNLGIPDSAAILRYTKDENDITINSVSVNKTNLTSLSIHANVVAIDNQAFYQCENLETVIFEDGSRLVTMGDNAFSDTALNSIDIPTNVKTIGEAAFYNCTSLETVTFKGSMLTTISNHAFGNCSSLRSVIIPENITTISDYTFQNCTKLESVTFADSSLQMIGTSAFQNCDGLSQIIIPAGVLTIGNNAFYTCDSLTTVLALETCDISNAGFGTNTNVLRYIADDQGNIITVLVPEDYELPGSLGIPVSAAILRYTKDESGDITVTDVDNKNITSVVIPASVVNIDNDVFESFTNLKTVLFAEGSKLTTIGEQVFCECSSLESIMIPESVTSIGTFAFRDCSSLEEISIPEGVTSINQSTFYGCSSLKVISIPASVTVIRSQAFRNCTSLTTVSFADESSLTQINANAFNGCTSLETITIPASVTSIGNNVFINCTSLNTVTFTAKSTGTILTITPAMFPQGAYVLNGGSVTSLTGDMDVTSSGNVTIKILVSVTPTKKLGSEDSTPLLEVDTDVEHYELENSILVPRMVSLSLAAPDESDYEFLGWFRAGTDDVLLCELPTYELIIKDDVSCEARYISGQKAIFKAYDVLTYTSIAGATSITMLAVPVPNYGWAFTGWKCEGDDELIAAGATYDIPEGTTGDITFTAQFQPIGSVVEDETVSVTVKGGQAQSIPIGWFTVQAEPPEGKYFDHWVQTIGNRTVTSYLNPGTFWVAEDCSIEAVYSDTPVAQIATAKLMSYHDGEFTFFITAPGTITEVGVVASSADDVSTANLIIGNTAVEYVRCVSKEMKRNSRTLNWRISALNSTWSVRPYVIYKVAGDTEGEVKTITTYGARSTSKNFII